MYQTFGTHLAIIIGYFDNVLPKFFRKRLCLYQILAIHIPDFGNMGNAVRAVSEEFLLISCKGLYFNRPDRDKLDLIKSLKKFTIAEVKTERLWSNGK
jgi:hypothetical protein